MNAKDELRKLRKDMQALQQRVAAMGARRKSPNLSRLCRTWLRVELKKSLDQFETAQGIVLSAGETPIGYEITVTEVEGKVARKGQVIWVMWHQPWQGSEGKWIPMGLAEVHRGKLDADATVAGGHQVNLWEHESDADIPIEVTAQLVDEPTIPLEADQDVYIVFIKDNTTSGHNWEILPFDGDACWKLKKPSDMTGYAEGVAQVVVVIPGEGEEEDCYGLESPDEC